MMLMLVPNWCLEDCLLRVPSNALPRHEIRSPRVLKAVCHVSDWLQESGAQHKGFLCESVYLKQRRADHPHFLRSHNIRGSSAIQIFLSFYILSLLSNQMRQIAFKQFVHWSFLSSGEFVVVVVVVVVAVVVVVVVV